MARGTGRYLNCHNACGAHVSSTFYGGGVSEILTPLTLMMNAIGIETDWHLIQGTRDFLRAPKSYTTHCKAFL